jgi:hypothetical protein
MTVVLGAALIAGCGTSKAEENAKLAKTRFVAGQPCAASTLEPTEPRFRTACEGQQRKERSEKELTEKREAAERKAAERREKAQQRAEEAKTKREEAETKEREEKSKAEAREREEKRKREEAETKEREEHKGEANNRHRWSEELRTKEVSTCEATAAEGEASKNTCECAMDKMEALESEEQILQLEALAQSQGMGMLSRLLSRAREGC